MCALNVARHNAILFTEMFNRGLVVVSEFRVCDRSVLMKLTTNRLQIWYCELSAGRLLQRGAGLLTTIAVEFVACRSMAVAQIANFPVMTAL